MSILGIDIGTTTITALLLDEKHGKIINKSTFKNDSFIESNFDFEKKKNEKTSIYNNSIISIGNLVPKHQRGEPQSRHRIYSPTAVRQRVRRPSMYSNISPRHCVH